MTDTITLTGLVATPPHHVVTRDGLPITSFRLASTQRRFDRVRNAWVDSGTNWYTVTTFRQLAMNLNSSIKKGERVVVTGRLRIREWTAGEKGGTNIEVDADAVGHDLSWGTASFTRIMSIATIGAPVESAQVESARDESSSTPPIDAWATASMGADGGRAGEGDSADIEVDASGTVASNPLEESVSTPF